MDNYIQHLEEAKTIIASKDLILKVQPEVLQTPFNNYYDI